MNYCIMCGKTAKGDSDLCSKCQTAHGSRDENKSLEFARILGGTSIPDMIKKNKKYSLEPGDLIKIQDILVEVGKYEKEKTDIMTSARMYHLLGNFYSVLNNRNKALDSYDKAVRITPDNTLVLREKIRLLEELGRPTEANDAKAILIRFQKDSMNPPPLASPPPPALPSMSTTPPVQPSMPTSSPAAPSMSTTPPVQPSMPTSPLLPPGQEPPGPSTEPSMSGEHPPSPPILGSDMVHSPHPSSAVSLPPSPEDPITPPSGQYGSQSIPVPQEYSYKAPDVNDVKARVSEAFGWINKLGSSGLDTSLGLEMLQKAQELLGVQNPIDALKSTNDAISWCENTFNEQAEMCSTKMIEAQNLMAAAMEEGSIEEEARKEMELAVTAYKGERFLEFIRHIESVITIIESSRNTGNFNQSLKEFSIRVNSLKERIGAVELTARMDEMLGAAAELLVTGKLKELGELLERGNSLLTNVEGMEEHILELPRLKEEMNAIVGWGGQVDDIALEFSSTENALEVDRDSFIAHFERLKTLISEKKNSMIEEYLSQLLDNKRSEVERLKEMDVDVSAIEAILDRSAENLREKNLTAAEEELKAVENEIFKYYSNELSRINEFIEQARMNNIRIEGIEEPLDLAVRAWDKQDKKTFYEQLSLLHRIVSEEMSRGNVELTLNEFNAEVQTCKEILGDTGTINTVERLLERAGVLIERGEPAGIKQIMEQIQGQMDSLKEMKDLYAKINGLKREIEEEHYPDFATKGIKRELTIAARMMDSDIGFAKNYVINAEKMMEDVRGKFIEERMEQRLNKCNDDIEKLENRNVDLSFARALYEKITDVLKDKRYEEADVLFTKLHEEISNLKNKVYSKEIQERFIKIQDRMKVLADEGVDDPELDELLTQVEEEMKWGDAEKAMGLLDRLDGLTKDRVNYKEVIGILKDIRKELNVLEEQGVDIRSAESILLRARPELENGNYEKVRECADQCRMKIEDYDKQREFLDTLENLYSEIEEARMARIDVNTAIVLAETAKKDIMESNFERASNSIDSARDRIRNSVMDFHELTELVKLAQLKIDETNDMGADTKTLEDQYNDMTELITLGRYTEAKVLAKAIVERALSAQLSYISVRSNNGPTAPPIPPSPDPPIGLPSNDKGSSKEDILPSPPGNETNYTIDLLADIRNVYDHGPSPYSAIPPIPRAEPKVHRTTPPPPGLSKGVAEDVMLPSPVISPPLSSGLPSPETNQSPKPTGKSDNTSETSPDLLAEIRNIYSKLGTTMMACPYCSGNIPRDSTFCSQCGRGLK